MKLEINAGLWQVSFIVLKLTHVVGWAWKWVLAPTWIPLALGVVLASFAVFVTAFEEV